ncbi:MAG TPA: YjjG family noncanonical pyrimidine nucleotidase [Clostridiaceae bacterium]
MKKYELVLFDIDGTLLDFEKAEKVGMKETLIRFGLRNDDEVLDSYNEINISHWKMFEVGELSLGNLLIKRHVALFERYGIQQDAAKFNDYYESRLKNCGYLVEHALDILDYVKTKSCKIAIITNGIYETQINRITISSLNEYFQHVYISEKIGYRKPQKEIFEHILKDIGGGIKKENVLIVGDSLTSDIKGGNNFGIDTCWVNPKKLENHLNIKVDYEIQSLLELKEIIA